MADPTPTPVSGITLTDQAGAQKTFSPADVAGAVASGQWGAPTGTPVPIVVDGAYQTVPIEQLLGHVAKGASVASPEDYQADQIQQQYGDIAHQAEAAATGAASSLSLGLSDAALGALGPNVRQSVRLSQEANPLSYGAGSIAGALAPIALSGGAAAPEEAALGAGKLGLEGASAAVRGASEAAQAAKGTSFLARTGRAISAPQNFVTSLGERVEQAIASRLPEGATSEAAKLGIKAAALGARGATEGAIYSGTDYLGQQALSPDPSLDGEKLFSAVGHGALLGGAGGALLGIGTELGKNVLEHFSGTTPVSNRLKAEAAEQAASVILEGRNAKAAQKMAALPGGKEGVGDLLLKSGLVKAGDSVEEIAPRISAARQAAGAEVGALRKAWDDAKVEGPSIQGLHEALNSGVLDDLQKLPNLNKGAINKINGLKDDLNHLALNAKATEAAAEATKAVPKTSEEMLAHLHTPEGQKQLADYLQTIKKDPKMVGEVVEGLQKGKIPEGLFPKAVAPVAAVKEARMTFQDVAKLRAKIDDAINFTRDPFGKVDAAGAALSKARGVLEGEINKAAAVGEKAGLLDKGTLEKYQAAKLKYRQLSVADEAATKAAQAKLKNRKLSLSDYIQGGSAGVVGGALGLGLGSQSGDQGAASGGLLGTALGGLVGHHAASLGGALLHKVVRERGNATAAVLLDKIATMGAINKATAKVDSEIDRGVSAAMGKSTGDHPYRGPQHGFDTFDEKKKALEEAAKDMSAHAAVVGQSVAPLEPHAPGVAGAYKSAAMKATAYLLMALPKDKPANPMMPMASRIPPSEHDKAVFSRVFNAVNHPPSVLHDVGNGTVTPEQVKAIAATHPKMKVDMDAKLLAAMKESLTPLPMKNIRGITLFTGIPADPTFDPKAIASYQSNFMPGAGPKGEPGSGKPGKGIAKAKDMSISKDTSLESSAT